MSIYDKVMSKKIVDADTYVMYAIMYAYQTPNKHYICDRRDIIHCENRYYIQN